MNIKDIHIGDMVRFRQWDDMESEFGLDRWGDIACEFTFSDVMISLCGKSFYVTKIDDCGYIYLQDEQGCDDVSRWNISADMLEPPFDGELKPFDESEISLLLGI